MTTNQEGVHAAVRAVTGTSRSYNEDWHALFDGEGIAAGSFNARMLAWINASLGTSHSNVNEAMQAFAVDQGFANWSSMNTFESGWMNGLIAQVGASPDYVVDPTVGDDGNSGTSAAPWATLAPLRSAINDLAIGETLVAFVRAATYTDQHLDCDCTNYNLNIKIAFEAGAVIEWTNPAAYTIGTNQNGIQFIDHPTNVATVWGNGLIVRGFNTGTGNAYGTYGFTVTLYDCHADDCVDGVTAHSSGNFIVHDCTFQNCVKAACENVGTGYIEAYNSTFAGRAGASSGIVKLQSTNSGTFDGCTFTAASSSQLMTPFNCTFTDCILGTSAAPVIIAKGTTGVTIGTGNTVNAVWYPEAFYDITDTSTLKVERTGASATTQASINGVVGTVLDKSGNGHHLTAPSDAARPLLRNVGSLYSLEFDGSDDEMSITTPLTLTPMDAFFGVDTTDTNAILAGGASGAVPYIPYINNGGAGAPTTSFGSPTVYVDKTAIPANTRDALHDAVTGSPHLISVVGGTLSAVSIATISHAFKYAGKFYAIAFCAQATASERAQTETALGNRCGLSI